MSITCEEIIETIENDQFLKTNYVLEFRHSSGDRGVAYIAVNDVAPESMSGTRARALLDAFKEESTYVTFRDGKITIEILSVDFSIAEE